MVDEDGAALININRDTTNVDKALYSVDRQQGNIDITVDHAQAAEAVGEFIGDVANALVTEVLQYMYDIDNPTVSALLRGKEEQTLDALIERGIDPSIAKKLLTDPEFYEVLGDILSLEGQVEQQQEIVDAMQSELNAKTATQEPHQLGEPLEILITGGRTKTPMEKVLGGLNTAQGYVAELPAEEAQAAMLALGFLTGGVVKTSIDVAKEIVVDTAIGDSIREIQQEVGTLIAAAAQGTDTEGQERSLLFDEQYFDGEGHATDMQNGAEFGLEVVGLGAGIGLLGKGLERRMALVAVLIQLVILVIRRLLIMGIVETLLYSMKLIKLI